MPHNKIRVFTHGGGGGFGGGRANVAPPAVVLAKKTGRVVALHADRIYQNLNGVRQFKTRGQIKIGAKKDGTITGIKADDRPGTNTGTDHRFPPATLTSSAPMLAPNHGIITNTPNTVLPLWPIQRRRL
jgi:CO/xanthine dehydrogenase Mo-binding subunit